MELREGVRGRAATWSGSKMASRKKERKGMKEKGLIGLITWKKIMDAMASQSELLLKRMEDMEENMDLKIEV